jgi:hypothetical protein
MFFVTSVCQEKRINMIIKTITNKANGHFAAFKTRKGNAILQIYMGKVVPLITNGIFLSAPLSLVNELL